MKLECNRTVDDVQLFKVTYEVFDTGHEHYIFVIVDIRNDFTNAELLASEALEKEYSGYSGGVIIMKIERLYASIYDVEYGRLR